MANEVPFPSTDHVIKYPDMWTDIAVNEIPKTWYNVPVV